MVADVPVCLVLRKFIHKRLKAAVLCGYPFTSYDKYMLYVIVFVIVFSSHSLAPYLSVSSLKIIP